MKKFLTDLIARKNKEREALKKELDGLKPDENGESLKRATAIGENLIALRDEITEAEAKLAELDKDDEGNGEDGNTPASAEGERSFNPLASYALQCNEPVANGETDTRSTMEYRTAFKNYVQNGDSADVLQYRNSKGTVYTGVQVREAGPNVLADLGVLLPVTVVQEIMKGVEKVYGQLYSRVRKMNVKGLMKFPIGDFGATFTRITHESGTQATEEKGGKVTGFVEFSYKFGSIRITQSLLSSVISVPAFEAELSKVIVETYVKAMENEILNGDGASNQMEGILTEANKPDSSRVLAGNIIEFTEADMKDWKKWQEKLFAKIPLSMRNLRPVFVMTANTYEANIKTLADDNNRPVYAETFNPVDGTEKATFKGREVVFVEEGLNIENFNDASDGEFFGLYLVPDKAYGVNTNLEFAVRVFYDEARDVWVNKAIVMNDGKILDPKYLYLLKKKAGTV